MNAKQQSTRAKKMTQKRTELRAQLWPDLKVEDLWNRKEHDGFTTIPRTFPHIFQIMDELAGKGKPVSSVYLSLWCRVFDESMLDVKSMEHMAFESGFSGQRAVTTWKQRMKTLEELGFISAREGASGEYSFILVYNPYKIILRHRNRFQGGKFNALLARAQEVGATDLQE
ncbi:hypothetical protein PVT68_14150 [Microbulbifer bruguierae]|uniref:Uncharacterized protein n=1 Tax=Microbulbifer bruguierae TaxID=3029061 RepID=A0ABY8NCV8_9GAMM|nr:hypothetical protein [Microbulbifer bruguierae]WGL15907.1 hypothetical protein PVT68_14150 [Microbulbifer bruguierae]